MTTTDWPYANDGVKPCDFTEQFRYPIVNTSHPRWSYVTAVVVSDDQSWLASVRPTDDELRIIASFHEEYCSYFYGLARHGWRATMERKYPFDIDGSANSRILIKHPDGTWAYRKKTWNSGPLFVPPPQGMKEHKPLDLFGLLDHIHGGYCNDISKHWLEWKATHPDVFTAGV